MPQDTVFDQAQFKSHLDTIYKNQIIDDTYPQRPQTKDSSPAPQGETPAADDSANAVLPRVTITNRSDSPTDYLNQATDSLRPIAPVAPIPVPHTTDAAQTTPTKSESVTDIVEDRQARDLAAQKALLAHPEEMRRLFPEMSKAFDTDANESLNLNEINKGLGQHSLNDLQRNYLTVLKNAYGTFHDVPRHGDDPGIEKFDMAKIDRAMNPKLDEDPLYVRDALLSAPKFAVGAGLMTLRLSKGGSAKDKAIDAGVVALGALAISEGGYFLAHQFGGYNGSYEEIAKKYRIYVGSYGAPQAVAAPKSVSWTLSR